MAYKVLTSQQLHKLHDMYLNGSSIADIAKELNCTTRTVYYHINKNKSKASKVTQPIADSPLPPNMSMETAYYLVVYINDFGLDSPFLAKKCRSLGVSIEEASSIAKWMQGNTQIVDNSVISSLSTLQEDKRDVLRQLEQAKQNFIDEKAKDVLTINKLTQEIYLSKQDKLEADLIKKAITLFGDRS